MATHVIESAQRFWWLDSLIPMPVLLDRHQLSHRLQNQTVFFVLRSSPVDLPHAGQGAQGASSDLGQQAPPGDGSPTNPLEKTQQSTSATPPDT